MISMIEIKQNSRQNSMNVQNRENATQKYSFLASDIQNGSVSKVKTGQSAENITKSPSEKRDKQDHPLTFLIQQLFHIINQYIAERGGINQFQRMYPSSQNCVQNKSKNFQQFQNDYNTSSFLLKIFEISKIRKNKDSQKLNNEGGNPQGGSQDNQFSLININQVHTYTVGRCGYCQDTKWMTSGFDCAKMALKDYQLLMDRGWRRCGTYFYKPHVDICCCRTFSIRLNGVEYKHGNSQKKVMRKFEKMLNKQDEKTDIFKKGLGDDNYYGDSQNDDGQYMSQQEKTLMNMYEEYDEEEEDDDDDDDDDDDEDNLLVSNSQFSQLQLHNDNLDTQNSQTLQKNQKSISIPPAPPPAASANNQNIVTISKRSSSSKDVIGQQSSQSIASNSNLATQDATPSQTKIAKQQNLKVGSKQVKGKAKGPFESILIETDVTIQQNYMSQIDQELMNEIKDRAWSVLRLCLNNIKNNLSIFLEALGLPVNEKMQELIFDERIMEQSRLYQNKNMIKNGTHSTNFLITFYRLNLQVWGEVFCTKEKFFAKSYTYFEAVFECANQELVKKNIRLKLRTCGEINVHYMKRSFLKRVSELTQLKNSKNRLANGTTFSSSSHTLTPQLINNSRLSMQIVKKNKQSSFIIPAIRKNFYREIVRAEFNEQSYELYKRYNKVIHNNMKTSKESYKNFLCLNGLRSHSIENSKGKVLNFGCFHFKYYLDDVLIAVSVVDILPDGLSSVYYFYEPDLKKYSLGVIGNLRDIDYIKEMSVYFPTFRYYYLGYYIHNNSKMSYKASYKPFELLCPITYRWVMYDKVTQDTIHEGESPRLSLKEKIIDDMDFEGIDIEKYVQQKVKLYISGRYIKINQIKQSFITYFQYLLSKLVTLLGRKLSESLVFGQQ